MLLNGTYKLMMFQLVDRGINVGLPRMKFNIKPRFQKEEKQWTSEEKKVQRDHDTISCKYVIVWDTEVEVPGN